MTANILKIATAIIKLNNKIHLLNPYFFIRYFYASCYFTLINKICENKLNHLKRTGMMEGYCGQTNTFNSIGQLEWILEASYYYT